jgi:hypothetical protein
VSESLHFRSPTEKLKAKQVASFLQRVAHVSTASTFGSNAIKCPACTRNPAVGPKKVFSRHGFSVVVVVETVTVVAVTVVEVMVVAVTVVAVAVVAVTVVVVVVVHKSDTNR